MSVFWRNYTIHSVKKCDFSDDGCLYSTYIPAGAVENKAVPVVDMCVHLRLAGDGSAMAAGLSGCIVGGPGCGFTCGCLSSLEDGVEAAGVVGRILPPL